MLDDESECLTLDQPISCMFASQIRGYGTGHQDKSITEAATCFDARLAEFDTAADNHQDGHILAGRGVVATCDIGVEHLTVIALHLPLGTRHLAHKDLLQRLRIWHLITVPDYDWQRFAVGHDSRCTIKRCNILALGFETAVV